MKFEETIVLSLGGSLIVPNGGIDVEFLKQFNSFIRKQIAEKKRRFFIVCGGGATARSYISAGTNVISKSITNEDKDWLGIHSTRLNAHLVKTIFRDIAYSRIFKHYDRPYDIKNEPVIVCSGWKPGWSTDYCAVLVAQKHKAKTIVNLSNIDKVYDKDPRKYKNAKPIDKTTWEHFETLVGDKWVPGLNAPFDPVATQRAKKLELTVIILNGRNIRNLSYALDGEKFTGSVIAPFRLDASFYDREYYEGAYGIYSGVANRPLVWLRALYRALVIKFFIRPRSVLDVGCGLGHKVYLMRKLGIDAKGLEISQYALKHSIPQVRDYLKQGDVRDIPYKANTFDLVTTFGVLHHLRPQDIDQAIKETRRVTKKLLFHNMYTRENTLAGRMSGTDLSLVSVHNKAWWRKKWQKHNLEISALWWPRLPDSVATSFLLEK